MTSNSLLQYLTAPGWRNKLEGMFPHWPMNSLEHIINQAHEDGILCPKIEDIFKAYNLTDFDDVKVVIIGQDPYFSKGMADGLAFSSAIPNKRPPSLRNIFELLEDEYGYTYQGMPNNLDEWAKQGVLLLNGVLTTTTAGPMQHSKLGWFAFIEETLDFLDETDRPIVFMLWGKYAQGYSEYITNPNHLVIKTSHPAPLSAHRGFFDSRCFTKANKFLVSNNIEPVDWRATDE